MDKEIHMIIGYSRTSTRDQKNSLQDQERRLREAGAEKVYIEERSAGQGKARPELDAMLNSLREGDKVVVTKLDRISRSLLDFMQIWERVKDAGATLSFLDNSLPTDDPGPAGKAMMQICMVFAEMERDLIRERVQTGVDSARARGKRLGRPPVDLSTHKKAKALRTLVGQGTSISEAARTLGVARSTAQRWLAG